MAEPFFRATGVKKSFGETEVLRGIDLEMNEGEVMALIGPSGSGKTTLLRALDYLDPAQAGGMVLAGDRWDLAHASSREIARLRQRTSFVFQNFNLFLNFTALENVTLGLTVGRGMAKKEARAKGEALLEKVGMIDHAGKYPSELSGGQQQRVAIARALAPDPALMFLDEPTSALDPERTKEILELLRVLALEGRTMIIVTHELAFARGVSTKTVLIEDGLVVEQAPSREFFDSPREARTKAFLAGFSGLQ
ncbi:amino acid ABC transporter ATP-binding protein [Sutterella sp.]|uniref:amino acid ABC transporter ATP-binding protein n=1 Tax=Sutterella sp. TaxID=1981025 RepID=UPI0026E056E5|nr:amino acid ABC transporter ATP-binding protein [Sutterella sp.]MDO5532163.1 amino acid ABC transporter ATP-binding protein [Sutterella sp.]